MKCAGSGQIPQPPPPVDLTTMGAAVDPAALRAHPDFRQVPELPEGEPDFHELVRLVRRLEDRQRELFAWQADASRAITVLGNRVQAVERRLEDQQQEMTLWQAEYSQALTLLQSLVETLERWVKAHDLQVKRDF